MFDFLKKKIKDSIDKFSNKVEVKESKEEIKEEKIEQKKEEPKEKKSIIESVKEKVTTTKINEEKFEELFDGLELNLLENNVAFEIVEKLKEDLKMDLVNNPLKRGEIKKTIQESLRRSINELFVDNINLIEKIKQSEKPFVIVFVGVNGSGKTTSIAKMAKRIIDNKLSCVLVAGDTFRAAAIDQLEEHGNKLNVRVIKQNYGSDPAAVAFDGVKYAKSKHIDVVLIDTAGRQHSNKNLMEEIKKIIRVVNPNMKIFIGESITGNDCVEQAREFNKEVGVDGIILSKVDVDEKGGAAISISFVIQKPILYFGIGQNYEDLEEFDKEKLVKSLGLE